MYIICMSKLLDSPLYSSTINIYGFPLKKNFKKIPMMVKKRLAIKIKYFSIFKSKFFWSLWIWYKQSPYYEKVRVRSAYILSSSNLTVWRCDFVWLYFFQRRELRDYIWNYADKIWKTSYKFEIQLQVEFKIFTTCQPLILK